MSALGSLSPFPEDEKQFIAVGFGLPGGSPPLSCPRPPSLRCPFFRRSTLRETGSGMARRPPHLQTGVVS
jgi:hypothetical protein